MKKYVNISSGTCKSAILKKHNNNYHKRIHTSSTIHTSSLIHTSSQRKTASLDPEKRAQVMSKAEKITPPAAATTATEATKKAAPAPTAAVAAVTAAAAAVAVPTPHVPAAPVKSPEKPEIKPRPSSVKAFKGASFMVVIID